MLYFIGQTLHKAMDRHLQSFRFKSSIT